MIMVRFCKILLVFSVAVFLSVVVYQTLTHVEDHRTMVQQIMGMEFVVQDATTLSRLVTDPEFQRYTLLGLIGMQCLALVLCWVGCARLFLNLIGSDARFNRAKGPATLGITLGFCYYAVGYLTVAGEWFGLRESPLWDGASLTRLLCYFGIVMIVLTLKDETAVEDIYSARL